MSEKPKLKITPAQLLEEVKKIMDPIEQRLGGLEKRIPIPEEIETNLEKEALLNGKDGRNEFIFHSKAIYIGAESPEKSAFINTKLADFMKDNKILDIKAEMTKKW